MKLFLLFICASFGIGFLLQNRSLKGSFWLLGGLTILVAIGYFFFRQI